MFYSHLLILLTVLVLSLIKICTTVSESSFHNIRDLRRIRNIIDQTTACTIAAFLIHSIIAKLNESVSLTCRLQK